MSAKRGRERGPEAVDAADGGTDKRKRLRRGAVGRGGVSDTAVIQRQRKEAIVRMLNSERRKHIIASSMHECYVFKPDLSSEKTVIFKGITDLLKRTAYANYDFNEAKRLAGPLPAALKRPTGLSRPGQGRTRGKLGHKQIEISVNAGKRALQKIFKGELLPQVDGFLREIYRKNLKALESEFIEYYQSVGMASGIDLLCRTTKKNRHGMNLLSLIEVKFGGENYFFNGNASLQAPPQLVGSYNNCPLHQAYLQLALLRQMVVDHYPDVAIGPCYVAQVQLDGTDYHPLPADFIRAAPALRDAVVRTRIAMLEK